jgi:PAS domain S-box-containing protein
MNASDKTKRQLLEEIRVLRTRNAKLESVSHEMSDQGDANLKPHTLRASQDNKELHNITQSSINECKMKNKMMNRPRITDNLILIGVGLAVFSWILESNIHTFIFHDGKFLDQILPSDANEFWMRLEVCFILICFSIYAQVIVKHLRRTKVRLQQSYDELEFRTRKHATELIKTNEKLLVEISERKKTEELLNIKNMAIASSISAMALTDVEGKLTYVNDSTVKMWGYDSADEILGRRLPEFWEGDGVFKTIKTLQEKGGAVGEYLGKRKDGSLFNVQFAASMIKDEAGNPLCMFGSFLDITERKKAEEALRESEERYHSLYSATNEGVALHELIYNKSGEPIDYRILDVNPAYESILGLKREEVVGAKASDLYGTGEAPYLEIYKKVAVSGESFTFEDNFEPMAKHFKISVFSPAKGKFATLFADITERKRAEERLLQSEERFKVLFESAPDAYYIHDLEGHFIDGNKAAEQLIGYSREETLGKNSFELGLVAEEDIPQVRTAMADNKDGKPAGPLELTVYRKDGGKVMVETRSYPVEIGGQIVVLGIARDITERKKVQEALDIERRRLFSLLDELPGSIYLQAPDYTIRFANRYFRERFGEPGERLCYELFYGTDKACEQCSTFKVFETKRPQRCEWFQESNGRTYDIYDYPFTDIDGTQLVLELGIDITERKQMEERVAKSEELFSKAFHANPVPATITTVSNDKLLMVNDAWLKLIGFESQEEAIGKSAVELGLWADIVDREERNTNLQQSGSSDIQEMQVKTPSGRIRDCLYTAEMIDYEGQPHILSMAIDITERKRVEQEIQESEHFTKTIVSSVGEGVIVYDRNLRYLVWNKFMENLTGMSAEEILGEYSLDLFPHLREQGVDKILELALTGETVFAPATPYNVPGTGKKGWVLGTYSPHKAVNGEIIGVVATICDITERMEAQEALKKNREEIQKHNEFLNNVLESLTHPFLVIDANDYTIKVANSAARIAMLSEKATCYSLSHKLDRPCHELGYDCPLEDMKNFGHAKTMEHIHYDRNGNPQHVEIHSFPIINNKGNVTDIIEYCIDITKRKRVEKKVLDYQERLRFLASELLLAEERQRHRIATELHDNASQEIAFALTKLQNIRETASGDCLEPLNDVCEMMNKVVGNVRTMTFDICSPTLYKFGLETAVSELLEDKLGTRNEVSYSFCDDNKTKPLPEDVKVALFQSVRELVNNLIKHARANNVTVDIRRCKDNIRIAVSDDGVGFKVEELESSEQSRSGFGLFSIAERLKYIGGSFEFQSQPGFGSSFTLEAPLEANST